jgi:hypothetical protein
MGSWAVPVNFIQEGVLRQTEPARDIDHLTTTIIGAMSPDSQVADSPGEVFHKITG